MVAPSVEVLTRTTPIGRCSYDHREAGHKKYRPAQKNLQVASNYIKGGFTQITYPTKTISSGNSGTGEREIMPTASMREIIFFESGPVAAPAVELAPTLAAPALAIAFIRFKASTPFSSWRFFSSSVLVVLVAPP